MDLAILDSYSKLIEELERMFNFKGERRDRGKWKVVFTDDEGDMMLLGDDPWMYCSINNLLLGSCIYMCLHSNWIYVLI